MSNRRKLNGRRLAPGLWLLPPIGDLLDGGHGAPCCEHGHQLEYVGELVDQGDDVPPAFWPAFGSL